MDRWIIHVPGAIPSMESKGKATSSSSFQMGLRWSGSHWERINMEHDHLLFLYVHRCWTIAISLKTIIISHLHNSTPASVPACHLSFFQFSRKREERSELWGNPALFIRLQECHRHGSEINIWGSPCPELRVIDQTLRKPCEHQSTSLTCEKSDALYFGIRLPN